MGLTPTNQPPDPGDTDAAPEEDETLGGYVQHHNRPPAFEGSDGYPYTVSAEVEKSPDLQAPFLGYLVFPRWAETGAGIIGHLETPIITRQSSPAKVEARLESLPLTEVRALLDAAVARKQSET